MSSLLNTQKFLTAARTLQECGAALRSGEVWPSIDLRRGIAFEQLHLLEAAIAAYGRAIAFQPPLDPPQLAQAHNRRGECQRQLHRYTEAIADAETAVRLDPETAEYRMNLGYARFWARDHAGAVADLTRAIELNPSEYWAYAYRGRVYLALGDQPNANLDFSIAIAGVPYEPLFYLWRAEAYLQAGCYLEAEEDSTHGLALEPSDARLWSCRGWSRYEAATDLVGALSDFTHSIALNATARSLLGRGLVYQALGIDDAAIMDFGQFVKNHPGGAAAGLAQLTTILGQVNTE